MSGFIVKFVLVQNSNEESILEAAKAVQNAGLSTEKITQAKVDEINKKDSSLYVCDPFEGPAFDHLVKHGCRIIGSQCVQSCLQEEVPIPKASHPIYNVCMQGVEVSCSSIEKHDRDSIHKLVEWMGGRVSRSFTETVTHLIAGEVGSKKYFVAADLEKPIMLPVWIQACWERSQGNHFIGTSPEVIKEFTCPVFKGCSVCVTGLDNDERKEVKQMVNQCELNQKREEWFMDTQYDGATAYISGGRYSGELKFRECTHLIVNMNGPKGQKYEFAKKWKIPCVTIKWFYDSIQKGSCQNEDLYRVENQQNRSSTPKGEAGKAKPPRMSSIADVSAISVSTINMSTINETAMPTGYDSIMIPPAAIKEKLNSSLQELDALNVSDSDGNLFLDGCKIFLSGFSGNRLEKLRKVINAGGGTRFNQLNASVSHVIIGDKVQEHYEQLMQGKSRPAVVSAKWITDSFKQGVQLEEGRYSVLDLPTDHTMSPQIKSKMPIAANADASNDETKLEDADKTAVEQDDVMAMYMDQSKADGNRSTDSEITFNPKGNEQEENDQDETQMEQEDMDVTACIQQGVGIFWKKSFVIMGFQPDQEKQIYDMITLQQGTVLAPNNRRIADIAVVPVTGCEVKATVNEVLTNCWLQMSIEMEEFLDPNSNVLFSPVMLVPDALPLQSCVLSISQYAGVERDCLLHLAGLMGAKCQEYFVRKPSGALKANTHLLLKEADDSKKYVAAKKWKIPTVTKEWLLKCARTGTKQPEKDFPLETPSPNKSPQTVQEKTSPPNVSKTSPERNTTESGGGDIVEFKQPKVPSAPKSLKRTRVESRGNLDKEDEMSASTSRKISKSLFDDENEMEISGRTMSRSSVTTSETLPCVQRLTVDREESGVEDLKENMRTPVSSKPTNKHLSAVKGTGSAKGAPGVDTPSKFLGDNCNFRPSFDLDDVNAYLESPASQNQRRKSSMHRRKSSLPLDDLLSFNLAKAVANVVDPTEEGESQSQDDSVFHEKPPGVLDGVVICVGKKLSKKQGDYNSVAESLGAEYKWLYDESCTHFLFQGRTNDLSKEYKVAKEQGKIIVSPHWLSACEAENSRVEESLYPHTYNPKLTLPVMSSKTPARTPAKPSQAKSTPARGTRQSARKAVKVSRNVAKPAPISPPEEAQDGFENKDSTDSDEEMMRITEAAEGKQVEKEGEKQDNGEKQDEPAKVNLHEDEGSLEMRENFQKQFEEIMTSTLSEKSGRRRSRRQTTSASNLSGAEPDGASGSGRRTRSKRPTLAETSEDKEMEQKLGRPIESSQSVQITWDDPTSRAEREKIMAQLNEESPGETTHLQEPDRPRRTPRKSVRLDDRKDVPNQAEDMEDSPPTPTPTAPPIRLPVAKPAVAPQRQPAATTCEVLPQQRQQKTAPKFLLSGMSNEEKVDYGALIERLGGEVKDAQYFDPSCTHIVVGNPTRNEKYLASLASGKWVMHKSYLEACREQGVFVEEEDHEWGSATDLNSIPPQTAKLAAAATRWRQKLDEERKKSNYQIIPGAFDGWRVLLHVERARESGFKRLLQAGGAKIVGMRPPFTDFENATHGFFDFSKAKSSGAPVDLEGIVSAGVLCLKPEYIAQYLMEEPVPDPTNYVIKEVAAILQRLSSFSERSSIAQAPTPTKRKRESTMGTSRTKKAKR